MEDDMDAIFRLLPLPLSVETACSLAQARLQRRIDDTGNAAMHHITRSVAQLQRRMRERWLREDIERESRFVVVNPDPDVEWRNALTYRTGDIVRIEGFTFREGT